MLTVTILLAGITCLMMVLSVLFFPKIRFGRFSLGSYWVITLIGGAALLLSGCASPAKTWEAILSDSAINPIKILVLFLSMTLLSVFLDELGFFRFLACVTLRHAGASQKKFFFLLYVTVSLLTVFTSNDIVVLSFTPFICYFAKNAGISPIPYLAAEFVAANTWSMALMIGNPTNIYLVTATQGSFLSYLKIMLLPTVVGGCVAFLCLILVFGRKLSQPISANGEDASVSDRPFLWIGLVHLGICTLLMAVGSYLSLELWLVALFSLFSLILWVLFLSAKRRSRPRILLSCLRRAPWELCPFILSMFVMVEALTENGITQRLALLLQEASPLWSYGISSFLCANLINNIPMSVLYSSLLSAGGSEAAVYATVVGSNLGACLTPIGALAGVMWSSILHSHGLKFNFLSFLKMGVTVALPALFATLLCLSFLLV